MCGISGFIIKNKKLNILVTSVGSAPSKSVVEALKKSKKYDITVIGIDMNNICAGRFLCDTVVRCSSFKNSSYRITSMSTNF
jgi:Mrp family chromosome partitioning ATPase